LQEAIDLMRSGFFSRGDTEQFRPLIDGLTWHDPYLVFADFAPYAECQSRVDAAYGDANGWARMSVLNAARSGKFSSDRTIREYCADIWKAPSVPVRLLSQEEVKVGFTQ
jgi:glycogen phosphorylase